MHVDSKIMEQVKSVLLTFGNKYIDDNGALKRDKVIEDLDHYDRDLMTALLANQQIHDQYTEKVADTEIFKLNQFLDVFEYKEFWEDSFTKYANRIGLTSNGRFINDSTDVVLDFPYKDTVLKAGMSKEDVDKDVGVDEPFLNETLAHSEISELFEPKVLVNAKRYDKDGEHKATDFTNDDNLILKGNNLIALHSIAKRYAGKIDAIYIDPPFNTGKDSFEYNDRFNESAWLTFMLNRLQIAKKLLKDSGNIFIHIDINEDHALKVLMDNVFNKSNFVEEIIWSYGSASGGRAASAKPVNVHDYILHYAKDYQLRKQFKQYTPYSDKYIKDWFRYDDGDGRLYRRRQRGKDENGNSIWQKQYLDESKGVPLTTVWTDIKQIYANPQAYKDKNKATSEIEKDFGNSGQKPEKLLERIIKMCTNENDIVLDFFSGSGTTIATALKLNRKFIGIEQINSQIDIERRRLTEVIGGKQSGISKDVNWQGGGSFVYAELMEKNMGYLKDLEKATTIDELNSVYQRMKQGADYDFRVDLSKYENDPERKTMSFEDQKKLLIKMLNKNQLYFNEDNIDDSDVRDLISDSDYQFNKSFYGKGNA
jgi:adenine-specific DNA-methyltransferase